MRAEDAFLNHIELTDAEQQLLATLPGMPAYQVFIKLMEAEIIKAETDHFRAYADKEAFERTGLIAVAMRLLFERSQKEVARQLEAQLAGQRAAQIEKRQEEVAKNPTFDSILEMVSPSET